MVSNPFDRNIPAGNPGAYKEKQKIGDLKEKSKEYKQQKNQSNIQVAPLGQPWNLDINGNPEPFLKGTVEKNVWNNPKGLNMPINQDRVNNTTEIVDRVAPAIAKTFFGPLNFGDDYNMINNQIQNMRENGITPKDTAILGGMAGLTLLDALDLGVLGKALKPALVGVKANNFLNPTAKTLGEGTFNPYIREVPEGKLLGPDTTLIREGGEKSKILEAERENINGLIKAEREKGNRVIISDSGQVFGIPKDIKDYKTLIKDSNAEQKWVENQGVKDANIFSTGILEDALDNPRLLAPYKEMAPETVLDTIYRHYHDTPIENFEEGFLGARAGDNLNIGNTGGLYATLPETELKGFQYTTEFLGPNKNTLISRHNSVDKLPPGLQQQIRDFANSLNLEKSERELVNSNFVSIGQIKEIIDEYGHSAQFNKLLRNHGITGITGDHPSWVNRSTEPFKEIGLFDPRDTFIINTKKNIGEIK